MRKKRNNPAAMRCPYCGSPVILRSADGIYRENANDTMLYVCKRYPICDAYVRTHPGTYFDRLYLSGLMSKEQAYEWLACLIQAPMSEAHIGYLGEYYCRRVVDASRTMLASCKGREAL